MYLGNITIDNSVIYVSKDSYSQSEQIQDSKPNMRKNDSIPQKQNKTFSQTNKNFIKYFTTEKDLD